MLGQALAEHTRKIVHENGLKTDALRFLAVGILGRNGLGPRKKNVVDELEAEEGGRDETLAMLDGHLIDHF